MFRFIEFDRCVCVVDHSELLGKPAFFSYTDLHAYKYEKRIFRCEITWLMLIIASDHAYEETRLTEQEPRYIKYQYDYIISHIDISYFKSD